MAKTREERRAELLARMPEDYIPAKTMPYAAIKLEQRGLIKTMKPSQQARLFVALLDYADDYSRSYDPGLLLNVDGLDPMTAEVGKMMACTVKEYADNYRIECFGKSKANGGGRPPKPKGN